MKKIGLMMVLISLFLGSLSGCRNYDTTLASQTPTTMAQRYQGVIPCADCSGIRVSLALQQGGRYSLNEYYLGSGNVSNTEQGRWSRTAEKLVLISDKGEKRYFRPLSDGVEMMDTQGNPIQSANRYWLAAVK